MIERSDSTEALLDRFRQWLREAHAEAETLAEAPEAEAPEVGIYRLAEEFTALRHEVKLQTKGSRKLQEQAEALLPPLERAIEQFRAVEPKEAQAAWSAGRPLAEALADLDEALDRGRLEIEKARTRLVEEAPRQLEAALEELYQGQSALRRWLVRSYHGRVLEVFQRQGSGRSRDILEALLEGYGLIQNRLRRTLEAEQVRRIACVGQAADPDRMTVIEVVDDLDRPPGQVVEEVLRGYTWRGRVLRFAEVRAVRGVSV
ncbi:hypothetical protein BH23PLA1_BH23PLA1_00560 [soil metagenome]